MIPIPIMLRGISCQRFQIVLLFPLTDLTLKSNSVVAPGTGTDGELNAPC